MIYLQLFFHFAIVGLVSFGGGYGALPQIQAKIVDELGFMTQAQFSDVMVISEMTPGPISINAATFVGTNQAGLFGAICATLGFVFPSMVIMTVFALLLKKYGNLKSVRDVLSVMRPCVIGLIASAGVKMLIEAIGEGCRYVHGADIFAAVIFGAALFVIRKWKPSPIAVMLVCGAVGGVIYGAFGSYVNLPSA